MSDLQVDLSVAQDHVEQFLEHLAAEVTIGLIIVVIGVDTTDHGTVDGGTGTGGGDIHTGHGTMLQSTGEVERFLQLLLY